MSDAAKINAWHVDTTSLNPSMDLFTQFYGNISDTCGWRGGPRSQNSKNAICLKLGYFDTDTTTVWQKAQLIEVTSPLLKKVC